LSEHFFAMVSTSSYKGSCGRYRGQYADLYTEKENAMYFVVFSNQIHSLNMDPPT